MWDNSSSAGMRWLIQMCNFIMDVLFSSVQFSFISSPIGARTLKMPVPYSPPSVGAYTLWPVFFFFQM